MSTHSELHNVCHYPFLAIFWTILASTISSDHQATPINPITAVTIDRPETNIQMFATDNEEQCDQIPFQKRGLSKNLQSWSSSTMTSSSYSTDENGVKKTVNRATTQTKSPGRTSSWNTVDYNDGTVIARAVSRDAANFIIEGHKAYVNGNLVSGDVRDLYQPTYQRGQDGSFWFTNLPLGWEMDEQEKKFFKDRWRRINGQKEDYKNAGQAIMKSADRTLTALQSWSSPDVNGRNVENLWDLPRTFGNQFSNDFRNQFSGVYENQSPFSGSSFGDWDSSSSGGSSPRSRGNRGRGRRDVGREEKKRRSGKNSPRKRAAQSPRKYSRYS